LDGEQGASPRAGRQAEGEAAAVTPEPLTIVGSGVAIPGDCDGDGDVDLSDFSTFSVCFGLRGPTAQCPQGDFDCVDLNGDSWIDLTDFSVFSVFFGTATSNAPQNCS
jgi:hypothetical protein